MPKPAAKQRTAFLYTAHLPRRYWLQQLAVELSYQSFGVYCYLMLKILQKLKLQNTAVTVLFFMLLTDVAFIVVHLLHCFHSKLGEASSLLLDTGYGYPENFQFLKYTIILILLGTFIAKKNWFSFIPLLFLFILLFLDDVFQWHRLFGNAIYQFFHVEGIWRFSGTNVGSMLYAFILGVFCFLLIIFGVQKSSERLKGYYRVIFFMLSALFLFGFGVDVLNQAISYYYGKICLFTVIEEGGEMIVLSLLVWYLIGIGIDFRTDEK